MLTVQATKVRCQVRVVDLLYNAIRVVQKDSKGLSLRLKMKNELNILKPIIKLPLSSEEPNIEMNKFMYNPALERRIVYKQLPIVSF